MPFKDKQIHKYLTVIQELRSFLLVVSVNTGEEALTQFENQYTLEKIECCLLTVTAEELPRELSRVLSERWGKIHRTSMSYIQQPWHPVNQLCLDIAVGLAPLPSSSAEIDLLPYGEGPYFLLMPTLESHQDVSFSNIHQFALSEFILSDDGRSFIPLAECLANAYVSDNGVLMHTVSLRKDGLCSLLSLTEKARLINHSPLVKAYYEAIVKYNTERLFGDSFVSELIALSVALEAGSVKGSGKELIAGIAAIEGIAKFNSFWEPLPLEQKKLLYLTYPEGPKYIALEEVIDRLMRPKNTNGDDVKYCIRIIFEHINSLIAEHQRQQQSLIVLLNNVKTTQNDFESAVKEPNLYSVSITEPNSPRVLRDIYPLSQHQQNNLFQWVPEVANRCVLKYTLAHNPSSLMEFVDLLDDDAKQCAITSRFNGLVSNESALIIAVQCGATDAVTTLLTIGADIEAQDENGSTALHWAAYKGYTTIVDILLAEGAQIDARGDSETTALFFAIAQNHRDVLNSLLSKGAAVNIRNSRGRNALDCAISRRHDDIVVDLLNRAIQLPVEDQSEFLQLQAIHDNVQYKTILHFAAKNYPSFVHLLLERIIQENFPLPEDIFNTHIFDDETLLWLMAKAGNASAVRLLIKLGADLGFHTANGSNLLHWAASFGRIAVVHVLLDHKELIPIDVKGCDGNTALYFAVRDGQDDVVSTLLEHGADMAIKNDDNENSFELALRLRPEYIKPLLLSAVLLTTSQNHFLFDKLVNLDGRSLKWGKGLTSVLNWTASQKKDLFVDLMDQIKKYHLTLPPFFLNCIGFLDKTALILMVEAGNEQAVSDLLALGADADIRDCKWWSALHYAVSLGHTSIIDLLLKNNADINCINRDNKNVLDLILEKKEGLHSEITKKLLFRAVLLSHEEQKRFLSHTFSGIYQDVLGFAANKRRDLFLGLLKQIQRNNPVFPVNILNSKNNFERTPLILMAEAGHEQAVSELLALGADITRQDRYGFNALNCAAHFGHFNIVNLLLKQPQIVIDARTLNGNTALHWAVVLRHPKIVCCLLDNKAQLTLRNKKGKNVLDLVLENQKNTYEKIIEPLLVKAVLLNKEEQEEFLSNVDGGRYKDVLMWVADKRPHLISASILVDKGRNLVETEPGFAPKKMRVNDELPEGVEEGSTTSADGRTNLILDPLTIGCLRSKEIVAPQDPVSPDRPGKAAGNVQQQFFTAANEADQADSDTQHSAPQYF